MLHLYIVVPFYIYSWDPEKMPLKWNTCCTQEIWQKPKQYFFNFANVWQQQTWQYLSLKLKNNIVDLWGGANKSSLWWMVKWSWVWLGAPHTSTETLLPTLPMESGNPTFFRSLSCKPARWRSSFRLFSKKPSPSRISIRKIWPEHSLTYFSWMVHTCAHTQPWS